MLTYKAIILAMIIFYILQFIVKKTLGKFCKKLKNMVFKPSDEEANEAHSDDFLKELLINPLTDLNNKANTELDSFKDFNSANFGNYRYEEEANGVTSEYYREILANKVNEIDSMIDNHLIAANGEVDFELKYRELE